MDGYQKDAFSRHHQELAGTIGNHISISLENAMLHEKAYKMAMEDALTGIGNRHRFQMEGRNLLESAIRSQSELSVIILDIDHFKVVNDRYGREEFVLILPETGNTQALNAAERVRTRRFLPIPEHHQIP